MKNTKVIGDAGEDLAADYLANQGYLIIERNFRTKFGEIDIISLDGGVLVFIEVKRKSSDRFGSPGEMITAAKIGKIRRTAQYYIQVKKLDDVPWRIDAVLIDDAKPEIIKNITL